MRGNGVVYMDADSPLHVYYSPWGFASLYHFQTQFQGYTHHEGLHQRTS